MARFPKFERQVGNPERPPVSGLINPFGRGGEGWSECKRTAVRIVNGLHWGQSSFTYNNYNMYNNYYHMHQSQ